VKARDIMTTDVETLAPDCLVGEAIRRFAESKYQAFPVVDGNGTLLGVLSIWHLLRQAVPSYIVSGELPDVPFAPDAGLLRERMVELHAQPVSSAMDTNPVLAKPDHSALECAALILRAMANWMHLLPVVDEGGRLLGVVAPWDLVR